MPTSRIQHQDFDFNTEKVQEFSKYCIVLNKKEPFWGQFCSIDKSVKDKLTLRRQLLLDPEAVASLNEGETPRQDAIRIVSYDVVTKSFGSYIKYSRQAYLDNRDDLGDQMAAQLGHSRLYDIESVRGAAFLGTTNTIVKGSTWKETLKAANTRLYKNKAKLHNGYYDLICTPEHADQITEEASADTGFAGTKEGETIAKDGIVGYWQGFRIIRYAGEEMYSGEHANASVLFMGLTDGMKFPVVSRGANENNVEVISHGIGSMGAADPTNENGTLASRIDNIAAGLERPECVLKCTTTVTYVTPDIPADYKLETGGSITAGSDTTSPAA